MDFVTVSNLIQSTGYNKINTSSSLIQYETTFIKGSEKIIVKWQLGGYVKSVSVGEILFESSEEFIKSFI